MRRVRTAIKPFAALFALLVAPLFTLPHPLADKVPADALAYVGWEGTTALGAAYDNSNLRGMVDAMNARQLFSDIMAKGMKDAEAQGKADDAKLFKEFFEVALASPTALYVGPFDMTDPPKPVPSIALICKMGKSADDLAKRLAVSMEKKHKESNPPSSAKAIGDYLVITIGNVTDLTPYLSDVREKPVATLAADPGFVLASKQVGTTSALSAYINGEALCQMGLALAKNAPGGQNAPMEKMFDVMGISAFKHGMFTGGFDGKNWSMQAFLEMAPDRHGYAAFVDNPPLSPDALKLIPQSASWASVGRFDGKRLLADIRTGAVAIDPAAGQNVNMALVQGGNFLGVDIDKDILQNHSDEWILYGNADAAGNSIRGITLVNKVKDSKVALNTFETLNDFANLFIAQRGGADAKLFVTNKKGDLALHSLELPELTPTWAVANDKFIFTVTPAAAESAAAFDGKLNLGDNPEFQGLVQKMGVQKYSSFSFVDTNKTLPEAYEVWTRLVTFITSQAKEGDPKITLPALEKIKPFMGPSLDLWWSDAAGIHMKLTEPFPGSIYCGGGVFSTEALMLPFIEKAQKAKAAANP